MAARLASSETARNGSDPRSTLGSRDFLLSHSRENHPLRFTGRLVQHSRRVRDASTYPNEGRRDVQWLEPMLSYCDFVVARQYPIVPMIEAGPGCDIWAICLKRRKDVQCFVRTYRPICRPVIGESESSGAFGEK